MNKSLDQNINWEIVSEQPIRPSTGEIIPNWQELYRSDNDKSIHVHKKSYTVFNNSQLVELTHRMAKITGGEVIGFEDFRGGRKVLGFVKPGNSYRNVNGLPIRDYIVIGNSHDGSSGIFLGTSTTLIRCTNAFSSIMKDFVIRHSTNYDSRLEEVIKDYYDGRDKVYEQFEKMKKVRIDEEIIVALTDRLFDIENREEISTQKANQLEDFNASLDRELTDLGSNAWGFFNAVTHYTTHKRGKNGANYESKNSFGNVVGSNANFNSKAVRIIKSELELS